MGTKTLILIVTCAVVTSITLNVIYRDIKTKYFPEKQSTAMHRFVTIDSSGMWYFGESFITSDCPPLNIDGYKCIRVEYGTNSKYYIYAKTKQPSVNQTSIYYQCMIIKTERHTLK